MVGITSAGSFGNLGSKIAASDFVTCASYCGKPPARRTLRRYGSSSSPSSSGIYRRDRRPNTGRHALLAGHQSQDHRRAPRLAPLPSNSEAGYAARPRPSLKLKIIEQFELQPGPVVARWILCRVCRRSLLTMTLCYRSRARSSQGPLASILQAASLLSWCSWPHARTRAVPCVWH